MDKKIGNGDSPGEKKRMIIFGIEFGVGSKTPSIKISSSVSFAYFMEKARIHTQSFGQVISSQRKFGEHMIVLLIFLCIFIL